MKIRFLFTLLIMGCLGGLSAQNSPNFWKAVAESDIVLSESNARPLKPMSFTSFQADIAGMKTYLSAAPMEFTAGAREKALLFSIPNPDGQLRSFRVVESPIIAPGLKAKYPELRTWAGVATDGSGDIVRLGLTYKGFHAYVFATGGGVQVVRPYAEGQTNYYMAYRESDLPYQDLVPAGARTCSTNEHDLLEGEDPFFASNSGYVANRDVLGAVKLRKYRIAIAAKGEYTVYHGGTVSQALSAIVVALNYIVAIQERDFDVRLELIANDDLIIWTDPNTDPYTGNGADEWMNQNPAAINPVITSSSYDIGHVFGVYVEGFAIGIAGGRVCNILNKARGSSNGIPPIGEYFNKVAAHEMCHQMSGTHTWNDCSADANVQRADVGAYEPGSGSTIMSYSGACDASNNVVNDSDPYYHIASIEQVSFFAFEENGATCGTLMETDNTAPTVTLPYTNGFYIPIKTPFELTGSATDAEDAGLTYCWEEFDRGDQMPLGQVSGSAPLFRSYPPVNSPTRSLPRIQTLISNQTSIREVLPDYDREINFKLTVRDNHAGAGGVSTQLVKFNSTTQAGPFLVSSPNSSLTTWKAGEYQTVTWDVANTNAAPVNCKLVNIKLSTTSGLTYDYTLATNLPNTGKACIQVPNVASNTARIRVEAADNIFFDISNANFKIEQPTQPGFSFCPGDLNVQACLPQAIQTPMSVATLAGFSDPVTFSAVGLPAGVTATFSPNPVAPGQEVTMQLDFPVAFAEGNFTFSVKGESGALSKSYDLNYTTVNNYFNDFALQTPANGAIGVVEAPVLHWQGVVDANYYEVQLATSPSFSAASIVISQSPVSLDSLKVPLSLDQGKVYYWRVRPVNECGAHDWSEVYSFVERVQSCATYTAGDLPKVISANSVNTVESQITVPSGGALSDVNVKQLQGTHQAFKDLEVRLLSPAGTNIILFEDKCSNTSGAFNFGMDDGAAALLSCPPSQAGIFYKPQTSLSSFNGQNAQGIWILRVKDQNVSSGGQLQGFQLELCGAVGVEPPTIVKNNLLQLNSGVNALIDNNLLKVEDANNTADQLVFTLVAAPTHGDLRFNFGNVIQVGDQFTQADINNGFLRYFDAGLNAGQDHFRFTVTDNQGGLATGIFNIEPFPVATLEPASSLQFDLAPNPADESVRIAFPTATESATTIQLFDATGRLMRTQVMPLGALTQVMEVATLPRGIYTVAVQNNEARGVKKLVVY